MGNDCFVPSQVFPFYRDMVNKRQVSRRWQRALNDRYVGDVLTDH